MDEETKTLDISQQFEYEEERARHITLDYSDNANCLLDQIMLFNVSPTNAQFLIKSCICICVFSIFQGISSSINPQIIPPFFISVSTRSHLYSKWMSVFGMCAHCTLTVFAKSPHCTVTVQLQSIITVKQKEAATALFRNSSFRINVGFCTSANLGVRCCSNSRR